MKLWIHPFTEALASLRRERRRLLPMGLGIVWGMASVMVLLAIAAGFEKSQRRALGAYGDRFILLRLNRAELDRAGGGRERRLMMDERDVERLRQGAPAIRRVSPMNMAYRARITGRSGAGAHVRIAGALPELEELRHLPLEAGRFHDELDEAERRRVIVLGPRARQQLFGDGPAIGQKVRVAGFSRSFVPARETAPSTPSPLATTRRETRSRTADEVGIGGELFEVIGLLRDVEVQRESYVSVERLAFIPFSTSCAVFDERFNTIFIEPRSPEDEDLALFQFKDVMGARYGFEPNDRNAVLIYFNAVERARSIAAIFGGVRVFLAAVGALILAVGAIGVMNVVLVSLASRRFEIGLRKALGATPLAISLQFFAETFGTCLASGAVGFLLGTSLVGLLSALPRPEGFSAPVLDVDVALSAFGLLAAVATIAGVSPARQAARLSPVVALSSRG